MENKTKRDTFLKKSGFSTERWSLWLSLVAILISFGGFYFQFLHHTNRFYVAFVGGYPSLNDSVLRIDLVFINKGTETESVIENSIVIRNKQVNSRQLKTATFANEMKNTEPIVLKPGEQEYRQILVSSLIEPFNSERESDFFVNDTVELCLYSRYINGKGYITSSDFILGSAVLDSNYNLQKLHVIYNVFRLKNKYKLYGSMYK